MRRLAELQLPAVPSIEELRDRARRLFASTPSLHEIAHRAHEIILENVAIELRLLDPVAA